MLEQLRPTATQRAVFTDAELVRINLLKREYKLEDDALFLSFRQAKNLKSFKEAAADSAPNEATSN